MKLVVFQSVGRFRFIPLAPAWVADCFLCFFIGARLRNVSLGCARVSLKGGAMAGVSHLSDLLSSSEGQTQRCK